MTTARNISRTLLLCLSAASMAIVLGCNSGGGGSWGDGGGGGWGSGGGRAGSTEPRRSTGPVEAVAEGIGFVLSVGGLFDGDQPDPCKVAAHKLKQAESVQKRAERAFRSTISKLRQLSRYADDDAARRSGFEVLTADHSSEKARLAAMRAAADEVRDTFSPVIDTIHDELAARVGPGTARDAFRTFPAGGWHEVVIIEDPRISVWYAPGAEYEHLRDVIREAQPKAFLEHAKARNRTKEAIRYYLRCKAITDAQATIADAWREIEIAADLLDDCAKMRKRS